MLNQVEIVKTLLDTGSDANIATGLTGETPLHIAARLDHQEIISTLLVSANVKAKSRKGWTALHYAAAYGRTRIAELLIDHGADVDAKLGASNTTVALLATEYGHDSVTSLLLCYNFNRSCTHSSYPKSVYCHPATVMSSREERPKADERDDDWIFLRSKSQCTFSHEDEWPDNFGDNRH